MFTQPVQNEDSEIVGLLDITKCLYESLSKMERAYGQSKKLYDALEGVDKEWGGMQNMAMVQYMETLREKMMCPDLSSVLDGSPAAEVSVKATVKDAAKLMKERRVTAVLVMDQNGIDIAGIFTSKGTYYILLNESVGIDEHSQFCSPFFFFVRPCMVSFRYCPPCHRCSIGAQQLQCGPCHDPSPRHCPLFHDHHGCSSQDARYAFLTNSLLSKEK